MATSLCLDQNSGLGEFYLGAVKKRVISWIEQTYDLPCSAEATKDSMMDAYLVSLRNLDTYKKDLCFLFNDLDTCSSMYDQIYNQMNYWNQYRITCYIYGYAEMIQGIERDKLKNPNLINQQEKAQKFKDELISKIRNINRN